MWGKNDGVQIDLGKKGSCSERFGPKKDQVQEASGEEGSG